MYSAPELLRASENLLSRRRRETLEVLDELAALICNHRRYEFVGIYLAAGKRTVSQAESGIAKGPRVNAAPEGELAVPVRIAGRTLGLLVVQSEPGRRVSRQDAVVLKQICARLAVYLATEGKALRRKLRQPDEVTAEAPRKVQPASERPVAGRRAAAGPRA
jgi:putative methionine-R-sulfoxide reductase with GAF domain